MVGLASEPHHAWLTAHGVIGVSYGDGVAGRIRQAAGQVNAFIDTVGGDYVRLAVEDLGVEPSRVDTIANFEAVEKYGIKAEGSAYAASAAVLAELAGLIAAGSWRCRSPRRSRWPGCRTRTGGWTRVTCSARSC